MSPIAFVAKYLGTRITSQGGLGGECVDLANQWLAEAYALPHEYRNAVDWAGLAPKSLKWTRNEPENFPPSGALVVFQANAAEGIGVFGHIALALLADSSHILSFDQNWPDGANASIVLHDYAGVIGWIARA